MTPTSLSIERRGTGSPVALVHGFSQTASSWRHIADILSLDHEVILPELPGHGRSGDVRVSDFSHAAQLISDQVGHAIYVGYSMGARLTLRLALDFPHLVDRMVLVGVTPGIADADDRMARQRADDSLANRLDPGPNAQSDPISLSGFFDDWLAQPMFDDLTPEQSDVQSRLTNTSQGLASALRTLGTGQQEPLYDRLSELTMPVLLIAGELDHKFAAIARDTAETIGPNAAVELIRDARHAAPFSQPERFLKVLTAFIDA